VGLVFAEGWLELGQPSELNQLVALMDDWDDMPQQRDATESQIMGAALQTLAAW
jgi:hypothetical protein